jgi:ABC-2 type transport system permease protein
MTRPRPDVLKGMLRKEFIQLFRDPKMKSVLFAAPLAMLLIFGYAANTDVKEARIAVLDDDRTQTSREFIESITSSGHFILKAYLNAPSEADNLLDSGSCEAFIRIDRRFGHELSQGRSPEVQLILDGTDPNRSMIILGYLNTITASYSSAFAKKALSHAAAARPEIILAGVPAVDIRQRIFFNENLESRVFFLPAIIGLLIGLITIMLSAMSIVRERETGTMEQIIVSPIRPAEFIMGKTLPFAIIAFLDIAVLTMVMILWFSIPFRGSIIFLLTAGLIYITACLGIGIYISTISMTQQQAMLSTFLFLLPAILLSGFIFPIRSMPAAVQWITLVNPMRFYMEIIRGIFLKGLGPVTLAPQLAALTALGSGFIILSMKRYARRHS